MKYNHYKRKDLVRIFLEFVKFNQLETVKAILEHPITAQKISQRYLYNGLGYALLYGYFELAQYFISNYTLSRSPLFFSNSCGHGRIEMLELFPRQESQTVKESFVLACKSGHTNVAKYLINTYELGPEVLLWCNSSIKSDLEDFFQAQLEKDLLGNITAIKATSCVIKI